ncbi:MAG: hypothetical protein IKC48_00205 [Clostridia bacterium]|nr:hypothetical protein [Clostridia bacterium]
MNLDDIINKYGMHALDIDLCQKKGDKTVVFAYCHQHDVDGQFMVNHNLMIEGKIIATKIEVDGDDYKDISDIYIHIAYIDKLKDGLYDISGVGGWIQFYVDGDLTVSELDEETYDKYVHPEWANH